MTKIFTYKKIKFNFEAPNKVKDSQWESILVSSIINARNKWTTETNLAFLFFRMIIMTFSKKFFFLSEIAADLCMSI